MGDAYGDMDAIKTCAGWYFQPEGRCGCTEGESDRMMYGMAGVEIWFRVRCRVFSRKLDESSALRFRLGCKSA